MPLDRQLEDAIAAHFLYLRDLGIFDFYRRGAGPAPGSTPAITPEITSAITPEITPEITEERLIRRKSFPEQPLLTATRPSAPSPSLPPSPADPPRDRAMALRAIRQEIGDCTRCALSAGRHTIVFGDGNPSARLMFVGEGPGADEDAQGLPFVGRAGQLLNNMITAMGLKREQVYIANIVKCRPPQNRVPEPEEAHTCLPFLLQQIDVIHPEVLVALGSTAALYLLGLRSSLSALRGRIHHCRGAKLIVTYHPAYLLRDPRQKKEAWKDLQLAMAELGLPPSR